MATKLAEGQSLKRRVRIHGIGEVEVAISEEGIAFRAPGTKTSTTLRWMSAVSFSMTPANVKSYYMGKPTQFLSSQVQKGEERAAKKRAKNEG